MVQSARDYTKFGQSLENVRMPLRKEKWLLVGCPKCGAKPGDTCKIVGKKHPFKGSQSLLCHAERVALFKQDGAKPLPTSGEK